ncbi:hypothetical protein LP419_03785 [Massilia sp. H-1]|nr:hypothetical protein LP419_03785 [Massilia sp. H-1]
MWPVGAWNKVTLRLHNEGARSLTLDLFDDYPAAWDMEGLGHSTRIDSGAFAAVTYRLCPDQRGPAVFGAAHLRVTSPLQLWTRKHRLGPVSKIKVFPDFSQLLGHTLSATDRRAPTMPARCASGAAAKAPISASCANTARATPCVRSTGRPPRA